MERDGKLTGFRMFGHSTACEADEAGRLVCAAISSAAYLTANTLTEIVGAPAEIAVDDAKMELELSGKLEECQTILRGFKLHIEQLRAQYPQQIQVFSEVSSQCYK